MELLVTDEPRGRRRRHRPRARTIAIKHISRVGLAAGTLMNPPVEGDVRPQTRGDCREQERPCPYVACRHHFYLEVNPETGSIKLNFPDLEPWDLVESCSLDVAERGGITLEEIGLITNLTRERVRQIEVRGLMTIKMGSPSPDEPGLRLLLAVAATTDGGDE